MIRKVLFGMAASCLTISILIPIACLVLGGCHINAGTQLAAGVVGVLAGVFSVLSYKL